MRSFTFTLVLAGFVFAMSSVAQAADGKQVFVDQKCTKCHEVKSLGIESTKKEKDEIIDLSAVGKEGHDAAWFGKFLKKEIEIESKQKKGKMVKHKKEWAGSDDELKTVSEWLTTLK